MRCRASSGCQPLQVIDGRTVRVTNNAAKWGGPGHFGPPPFAFARVTLETRLLFHLEAQSTHDDLVAGVRERGSKAQHDCALAREYQCRVAGHAGRPGGVLRAAI